MTVVISETFRSHVRGGPDRRDAAGFAAVWQNLLQKCGCCSASAISACLDTRVQQFVLTAFSGIK